MDFFIFNSISEKLKEKYTIYDKIFKLNSVALLRVVNSTL